MDGNYYVQVRYPSAASSWVTVALHASRAAAHADAGGCSGLPDSRGVMPTQVRVVSAVDLDAEAKERSAADERSARARRYRR
jgi:hypothetical protein